MAKELNKVYDPKAVESEIYKMWEEGGYFHAERDESKKPFTIVMPPPNVTGQLHMGHAMDATLQDSIIRFKRMQGYNALWIPGVDHAGIATQIKVEEELRKEGLTRYDLGREKFLKRVQEAPPEALFLLRLIKAHKGQGQKGHIILEPQPAELTLLAADGGADAAVDLGIAGLFLRGKFT